MPASLLVDISAVESSARIRRRAIELGFDLVGITSAEPSHYRDYFRRWLDEGQAGTMDYLGRRFEERTRPDACLPGARGVVCVALNYYVPLQPVAPEEQHNHAKIARYALGDDYHELIKGRLHELADWMREMFPGAGTKACVDTAPVMEKELAARAGIGWLGKNTCVIHPRIGSWLLLGEVLTTLELAPDAPVTDHCGRCTRCLDACPTGALTEPYRLDARRCISYLTIEHRNELPIDLRGPVGDWLYGCDICQDVCPYNRDPEPATEPALLPRFPSGSIDVREVAGWTPDDYRTRLRHSAMKRVKLPVLQRNAGVVQENLELRRANPQQGR